jgi:uncharacterized protein
MNCFFEETKALFVKHNVSSHHGYEHVKQVHDEAEAACEELVYTHYQYKGKYYERQQIVACIKLAALLHDSDDDKIFGPTDTTHPNATHLLTKYIKDAWMIHLVLEMITLVPASKNGNTIRDDLKDSDSLWMYIPQNADRNAALGLIGIRRCYDYSRGKGRPLFVEGTPLPKTMEELDKLIDPKRFEEYSTGKRHESQSTFDHFYDKLLHIGTLTSGNRYLQTIATLRLQIMKTWLLKISIDGCEGRIHPNTELHFDVNDVCTYTILGEHSNNDNHV